MSSPDRLPIKRVIAGKGDYQKNRAGGKLFDPLVTVDRDFRNSLAERTVDVQNAKSKADKIWGELPSVAVVTLHEDALAKTKRPVAIFNDRTCPIIGCGGLGTLYISVTQHGLEALQRKIRQPATPKEVSHLSTITKIRPYRQSDTIGNISLERLARISSRQPLRLVLFRHGNEQTDFRIQQVLRDFADTFSSRLKPVRYGAGVDVFEFRSENPAAIRQIANLSSVRSLARFPKYSVVRTSNRVLGSITANRFPIPESGVHYPLVGQIDTGTDPNNPFLQEWIADRWDDIPPDQQGNGHGSFVAGLICAGKSLNHNDPRFPSAQAKIVDVVAFDKTESISEQLLLRKIRRAVVKFPDVKVWNLSFSVQSHVCRDDAFSPFGLALAQLAEERKIVFVIAAGNSPELRSWPRQVIEDRLERICAPADSPTALVVGSLAHRASQSSCVAENQPSPFSRRGPGAGYLMAPHIAHIGGNCDAIGDSTQVGVLSVDHLGQLAEDIGTSFATPLGSVLLANVLDRVRDEPRPDILSKGLLLHATMLENASTAKGNFNHVGLGLPPDVDDIVHCYQSAATVVFQVDMSRGPNFVKEHFPIPSCLVEDGSLKAEIAMSVAYAPPINPQAGVECCQTNIKASLGTLHPMTRKFGYEIHRFPKQPEGLFEKDLVRYGHKWSPTKFYYRSFNRRNSLGDREWKLHVNVERRQELSELPGEHIAYIIATIRGKNQPVYDQMVVEMDRLGWQAEDLLQVRNVLRASE